MMRFRLSDPNCRRTPPSKSAVAVGLGFFCGVTSHIHVARGVVVVVVNLGSSSSSANFTEMSFSANMGINVDNCILVRPTNVTSQSVLLLIPKKGKEVYNGVRRSWITETVPWHIQTAAPPLLQGHSEVMCKTFA